MDAKQDFLRKAIEAKRKLALDDGFYTVEQVAA